MNDFVYIVPGLVAATFILTVGGVILLRPVTKRLGHLLEAIAAEKEQGHPRMEEHLARIRAHLEAQDDRLSLLEERVEFTERLVEGREEEALPDGGGT